MIGSGCFLLTAERLTTFALIVDFFRRRAVAFEIEQAMRGGTCFL